MGEKITHNSLVRGRLRSSADMTRCSSGFSSPHGVLGSQRREARGPSGRARLASEPRHQPIHIDGRRDREVL